MSNEDLEELLNQDDIKAAEKTRVKRMLPSEVWQGQCPSCQGLAVRIFPPRRTLNTIEKKNGIAGVLESCRTTVQNQRILIDTPSLNLILTGGHAEVDGFSLAGIRGQGGKKSYCKRGICLTDVPKNLVWHMFSHLRSVRLACMINGVSYQEVKDWFDGLEERQALLLLPNLVSFEPVQDPGSALIGGPWYCAWIDTDHFVGVDPLINSSLVNADITWDTCLDPIVDRQMSIQFQEYATSADDDDIFIDAPRNQLLGRSIGESFQLTVEPAGTPEKYLFLATVTPRDRYNRHRVAMILQQHVPTRYWAIENERLKIGRLFTEGDPSFLADLS